MPLIAWTNQMSVGVKLLDNDHRKLVLRINELHEGLMTGRAKPELGLAFERLVRCARVHFAHEERLFAETGYRDAAAHQQVHKEMIEKIKYLHVQFKFATEIAVELELMSQLKVWLFSHLHSADQDYIAHLQGKNFDPLLGSWTTSGGTHAKRATVKAEASAA
ncbi:MAG: bacteriohemerythrin [Terracidiphilus sp.]|jgi:hemerythrin-like metal-binding protein